MSCVDAMVNAPCSPLTARGERRPTGDRKMDGIHGPPRRFRSFDISATRFDVPTGYELIAPVGKGANGLVCSALDKSTRSDESLIGRKDIDASVESEVAIKCIPSAFSSLTKCKRSLREIRVLKHLDHENILSLRDAYCSLPLRSRSGTYSSLCPPDDTPLHLRAPRRSKHHSFQDTSLYLVTDLMDTDLEKVLESKQPLNQDHRRYMMYQLIRGVKYMHSAGVIHRDLKPGNLLLNENCDMKICDFGLSRMSHHSSQNSASTPLPPFDDSSETDFSEGDARPHFVNPLGRSISHTGCIPSSPELDSDRPPMTDYIATRWYRVPEIMLSWKSYTSAVDMWAIGCIMAELRLSRPLFPGTDDHHQIDLITDMLGTPSTIDLASMGLTGSKKCSRMIANLGMRDRDSKSELTKNIGTFSKNNDDEDLVDLLERLLTFDPGRRYTAGQALEHLYFGNLRDPADEPAAENRMTFEWESRLDYTTAELRVLIIAEIDHFRPCNDVHSLLLKKEGSALIRQQMKQNESNRKEVTQAPNYILQPSASKTHLSFPAGSASGKSDRASFSKESSGKPVPDAPTATADGRTDSFSDLLGWPDMNESDSKEMEISLHGERTQVAEEILNGFEIMSPASLCFSI